MNARLHHSAGRRIATLLLLSATASVAVLPVAVAQNAQPAQYQYQALPPDQLDSLVAPIALYPDPLLAQVMVAATFPQQVEAAAAWVRANGASAVDNQPWDVSVRAIAHYPEVLTMLDSYRDWASSLGAAYANQSTGVMDAVQQMRALAQSNGNLATNQEQQVVADDGNISIWPAQPGTIYVPEYDPAAVYFDSCMTVFCQPYVRFGVGYPIGEWLIYDWDWPRRRIFYTGWQGGGWISRSRPFVRLSGIYVNDRYRTVPFNRAALPIRNVTIARAGSLGVPRDHAAFTPTQSSGRADFRAQTGLTPTARAFVTRVPAPAARVQSAPQYRSGPPSNRGAAPGRQVAQPSASRPTYQYRQPVASPAPRTTYAAPRSAPAPSSRSSYSAAPRAAAPQQSRPAPASSGGASHSQRGGRGK